MESIRLGPATDRDWPVVAWLWQLFRHDLTPAVHALPYTDGRYQAAELASFPSPDGAGYLAWRPHPNTAEEAPIGFALLSGLLEGRHSLIALWVAPVLRREGIGRTLALHTLARHPGQWSIGFQHDNKGAGAFWRSVANTAFGPTGWREFRQPVANRPEAPDDHIILSSGAGVGQRMANEDLASVLAELFDATGGPLTEQELARARKRLTQAGPDRPDPTQPGPAFPVIDS